MVKIPINGKRIRIGLTVNAADVTWILTSEVGRLGEKSVYVPLSKALNPDCSCKSLWIRASAKM